jgi:DNA-binding transcriptional MocR family regulator
MNPSAPQPATHPHFSLLHQGLNSLLCLHPCGHCVGSPTYFLAPSMIEEHGFNMLPVPMTRSAPHQGLDLDALEMRVLEARANGALASADEAPFSGLVYCIPSYHNPTGATMPVAARERLVRMAREFNLLVLSDDVYELLHHCSPRGPQATRPPRLVSFDGEGPGHVVSNGTFSKVISPGVRCGWIEARPELISHISRSAALSSSGGSTQLMGSLIGGAIECGAADEMLEVTRATLSSRMAAITATFNARAPQGCELTVPSGGMCAWLRLPEQLDSHAVLVAARRRGVSFKPGDLFA